MLSISLGKLYLAATPIGNLEDVNQRFCSVAKQVNGVLCEDTRHSRKLFSHLGINPRLEAYHQHNEEALLDKVIRRLQRGEQWMLVSDAGTPLIQDPGYKLVAQCHQEGIPVSFLPGACAAIAALCVSGLTTDQFQFVGYLPTKPSKRRTYLTKYIELPHSVIFYLSPHRLLAEMEDVALAYGAQRQMSLVKEITKINENVIKGNAEHIIEWLQQSPVHCKGEFVLVVASTPEISLQNTGDFEPSALSRLCMSELREHLPLKLACKITEKISSQSSKELYHFFMGEPSIKKDV
jgi:16S rRNA (cytidine1402-2'-O)-methyltransferase